MDNIFIIDGEEYSYDKNNNIVKYYEEKVPCDSWYPETADIDTWEFYLERELDSEEKKIFYGVILEEELNKDMDMLKKNLLHDKSLFIYETTSNNGNCLFESLCYLNLGDDANLTYYNGDKIIKFLSENMRQNLAKVLLLIRNNKDFFPNIGLTPEEIFLNSNEIDTVYSKTDDQIYKYDYDMMLCDLYSNFSWSRLPTELLLTAISRIYQVKIIIYHNNSNYTSVINAFNDDNITTIRLGHINEEHYVPIIQIPEFVLSSPELYNEFSKKK